MLYKRNVGNGERWARGLSGGLMIACGILGSLPDLVGPSLIGAGLFVIVTGMFGFCPACAALGRRAVEETRRAS
jgi:Protein of unknown function (DUF2892)